MTTKTDEEIAGVWADLYRECWRAKDSPTEEAARRLGMTRNAVAVRVGRMRREGVPLPYFRERFEGKSDEKVARLRALLVSKVGEEAVQVAEGAIGRRKRLELDKGGSGS